jgi:signal transduction histidine kinase
VGVLLEDRDSLVVLIVEDDGIGFDVEEVMGSHVLQTNLGLYGMRERASLLGGTLTIESSPEEGTSVFVEIPLDREGYVRQENARE